MKYLQSFGLQKLSCDHFILFVIIYFTAVLGKKTWKINKFIVVSQPCICCKGHKLKILN